MQPFHSLGQIDEMKTAEQEGNARSGAATDTLSADASRPVADLPFPPPRESHSGADQLQFASPGEKSTPPVALAQPSTPNAAQTAPDKTKPARGVVVIHAEKKRAKTAQTANASSRHMSSRLRQSIVLTATLVVLVGTLATLLPLSAGRTNIPLLSGLGTLIQLSQDNLQVQAQQTATAITASQVHGAPLNISHSQYVAIAEQDATNAGIPPTYFVRQIQLESGFNPNAQSPSGAEGIAQFMPSTAAGLGIDPWDPIQALQAAAKMMANSYHQYGDYAKALAAYNAGSANLNNAIKSCGSNWLSCMPAQTQHYVATIMGT